jgi:hypothetical protein
MRDLDAASPGWLTPYGARMLAMSIVRHTRAGGPLPITMPATLDQGTVRKIGDWVARVVSRSEKRPGVSSSPAPTHPPAAHLPAVRPPAAGPRLTVLDGGRCRPVPSPRRVGVVIRLPISRRRPPFETRAQAAVPRSRAPVSLAAFRSR